MPRPCVIFDFDGVIADSERLHLAAYNHTFAANAPHIGGPLEIEPQLYFSRYMVYGDHEALFHILRDHHRPHDPALIEKLAHAKHTTFEQKLGDFAEPLPGVRQLLLWLEAHNIPRAICSGARREEIVTLLDAFNLRHHFNTIVAIEDVRRGKPDPQGYNLAFDTLNLHHDAELDKALSLVIEDSEGGCAAAKAAGLRVLGVATSLPFDSIQRCATFALPDLSHLDTTRLAHWLGLAAT
jgi:HAD superfamily hydrolase (TIGR01509 family)